MFQVCECPANQENTGELSVEGQNGKIPHVTIDDMSPGVTMRRCPVSQDENHYPAYKGAGPWSTCSPDGEMPPRVAASGPAGVDDIPVTIMPELLIQAAKIKGSKPALRVERPVPVVKDKQVPPPLPKDQWTTWTYQDYLNDVRRCAKASIVMGLNMFESINIWGFNAPEWHISCIAAMFAGAKSAGLYPTDTGETAAYKVVHSQGRVAVLEDRLKVERLVKALNDRGDCTRLSVVVAYAFEPAKGETVEVKGVGKIPLMSWNDFLKLGDTKGSDAAVEERLKAIRPGHCATLIYTSGTTGDPKAVMISHDSMQWGSGVVLRTVSQSTGYGLDPNEEERALSYLPLSHVAGKLVDIVAPIILTAKYPSWQEMFFARSYDLKEKAIKDRLGVCKPTMFLGVPLVWEKIADQIRSLGAEAGWAQRQVANWAKATGLERAQNIQLGGSGAMPMGYGLADKVVLSKVKERLGLDKCKFGFTGAAPIREDTLEFFGSLGLHINEAYGMSECTGAATWSTDEAHKWGSCGWALPGFSVKAFRVDEKDLNKKVECPMSPGLDSLAEEFQGELCFRGRHVMMGYLACPDLGHAHVAEIKKKTDESIDADGWLHSGDKGMITNKGLVKITGRYKELIIGEGGENIAPVPIEDQIKKACDGIAEVMIIGDKRKYNIALVTLKAVGANGEVPGTDKLDAGAKRVNPQVSTISGAMDDKAWIDVVTKAITTANKNSSCCPNNAFKVQKFSILPTNFSEEANELTPTKKLKRKVVETRYAQLVEKVYATDGVYIRYSEYSE